MCAFLNRDGGLIVLGIDDNGIVLGINPAHFTPFPKNPAICRFLLQLGRYEQAGSGIYNVTRFLPLYSHAKPRSE